MVSDFFSDIASTVLSKTLDTAAARQRTIANNIANVETPGFKRSEVSFEDQLRQVLESKSRSEVRKGLRDLSPLRRVDVASPSRPDGNNVNIDAEIAGLARVTLTNKAASVLLEAKIAMLRSAISEGRR